jgi:hypothetical protein
MDNVDCVTWKRSSDRSHIEEQFQTQGDKNTKRTVLDQKHSRGFVIKTTVKTLNLMCVKPQRAGVIIYTVIDGAIYFGLGLDARTHDLTDFGGTIHYQHDRDVITGALREFQEETLEIFDPLTLNDIKHCPVIYDNNNLIIFIHLKVDPDLTSKIFNRRYTDVVSSELRETPEVCGITWLTWEEFQQSIHSHGIMFNRVQRFLARAEDFSYLL